MTVDLADIQPNKISRDLRDYVWGIYGEAGIGKTTLASKFEDALIFATEKGYLALPGVMAVDITNWSDFKKAVKQLKDEKVKEKYKFIFIDVADIAWAECEKFVCRREGVDKVGDIGWGQGHKMVQQEFFNALKTIINEGYGFGWVSHSNFKSVRYEGHEEYQKVTTTLPNKARELLFGMSDVVLYGKIIRNDEGEEEERKTYVRTTSKHDAKSRFRYMKESFPFTYEDLLKEFNNAIDKEEEEGAESEERTEKPRYEETEEDKLEEIIEEVMNTLKEKQEEGVTNAKMKEYITHDPRKVETFEEAQQLLEVAQNLQPE